MPVKNTFGYIFLLICCFFSYFLIWFSSISASLQRRPSFLPVKLCDKPCFNGGSCIDGVCVCPPGWTGLQCDQCFGRIKRQASTKGFLTDGPMQYSSSSKCVWILENDRLGPLLFKFEEFFTECCWDHLYIYDGDGTYNNLIGVFSGSLPDTQIVAKSGQAVVFFTSDLAFNLPGFNISYEFGLCAKNCSQNGKCLPDGSCECRTGYIGEQCQYPICTLENENSMSPCNNHGTCKNGRCECRNNYHGDNCQETALSSTWDFILTKNPKNASFQPRASHKLVYLPESEQIWIFGGFLFENGREVANDIINFDVKTSKFDVIQTKGDIKPLPRYDHSVVFRKGKIYVFGGVIHNNLITNEFWAFDTATKLWEQISTHNESQFALPMALAGHSAHVSGDEMHVLFGYNPYEGYVFTTQIYSFSTGKWFRSPPDPVLMGRFAHASVAFEDLDKTTKVLVHGGYTGPVSSGYSYSLSDELLLYNPGEQAWSSLGNSGIFLFRHSAVLLDGGIMLIVGGNSHNETSTIRKTDCYSNQVFAYDAICKKWLKFSMKGFEPLARYGHESFSDGKSAYVLGGFKGQMLNDILKFTPSKCDAQSTSAEDCENSSGVIPCIYHNKSCSKRSTNVTLRQPFISLMKGENHRTFQFGCDRDITADISEACTKQKDCATCVSRKNCGWCESIRECLNSDAACADGAFFTDASKCAFGEKVQRSPRKLRPCSLATNCFACRQLKHCTWFVLDSKHSCISLEDEMALIEEYNRGITAAAAAVGSSSEEFATGSKMFTTITTSSAQSQQRGFSPLTTTATESPPILSSAGGSNLMVSPSLLNNNAPHPNKHRLLQPSSSSSSSLNGSTCPLPCFVYASCQTCIQAQCMWCPSTRRCVAMDTYMIAFPYGQCQSWVTGAASNTNNRGACQLDPYNCELQKTCAECQQIGTRCGWCDDGSGTGLGKCIAGTNSGPLDPGACPASKWFFTGEPSCQCNGHSTCTENTTQNKKCRGCQNRTRGDHCEQCDFGYFGDPRNGGSCQECQCNGQAKFCNPETGDCYCSTKGVTGPHCDRCEPKYYGDPKMSRPCTYELITDFIFTFKLDGDDAKDKYVNQINFFSTPFKRDTDVQFSIICEGESGAKVSINLTNSLMDGHHIHTKPLMAGHLCTSAGLKRTYSSADPGFAFGTEANTTFYVKVNDFVTPIKIQISFAQSPPINWILFFVIFAACFIILLVVAGLLWMIKLRVEWYRNIRRRNDEIEEMASRPLGNVQLDLSRHPTNVTPAPLAVEPCRNNQFGVYTLVVRLPTGGAKYTPYGTSGLAIASSLCYLTQAQLALLQPPNVSKQQNRKSALRRLVPFMR